MRLKMMALKLSVIVRFAHLPFGIGTTVPFNMPSGDIPLHNIEVKNKGKYIFSFPLALRSVTYVEKYYFTPGGSMFVMLVVCTNQEWGKW